SGGGDQLGTALLAHDVYVVITDVGFHGGRQLGAFGLADRDEVLDVHGVQHLAANAVGSNTGADALAGRVDGRSSAGRATANHQHVKRCLGRDQGGRAGGGTGVHLGNDLGQLH